MHALPVSMLIAFVAAAALAGASFAAGSPSPSTATAPAHRPLAEGEIAVTAPGSLDKPGATYVLTKDVTADGSGLFLAKDVTLDLNGYTLTYSAAGFEHMPNGDFEEQFKGWDTSAAPHAKAVPAGGNWEFTGKTVVQLAPGDEIVSPYVNLPVANRSYYAVCGVLTDYASVEISVEDAAGKPVEYAFKVGDREFKTCPVTASTILDGGVPYAHFRGQPAGKYRVRIKAVARRRGTGSGNDGRDGTITIDRVDILPAFDVGVGIVGKTWVYSEPRMVIVDKHMPCFVDYTVPGTRDEPVATIPNASGSGEITVRNGTIVGAFAGIQSWGVQTTGAVAAVNIENVNIVSRGINANAATIPTGRVIGCTFETDTPFVIERHNLNYVPVVVNGSRGAEVANCRFLGGQGNLTLKGTDAKVHDNLFVDYQRVVNHYAISLADCERARIYRNKFDPKIGCGINVYRSRDNEIYENTFTVRGAERNCSHYNGAGLIVGVRVSDYDAKPGAPAGTWGTKVHHNAFTVSPSEGGGGRACAIFSSTGGGVNEVSDNEITLTGQPPSGGRARMMAFYIGASHNAGIFARNRIASPVTPIYLGVGYGPAGQADFEANTFVKSEPAEEGFQPFTMGYDEATDIRFRSTKCVNCDFGIKWVDPSERWKRNTYSVWWTLKVKLVDGQGKPVAGGKLTIVGRDGKEAFSGTTGDDGTVSAELLEYNATATRPEGELEIAKDEASPYTVSAAGATQTVDLTNNTEITLTVE
jgi:hypothetical protein